MNIGGIPFSIPLGKEVVPTSPDPLSKKTSPNGDKPPSVELDHRQDATQQAVRPVVNGLGMGLEFSIDKDTGITVIKVLNVETGEVVRQIPPEEVLAFMREFEKNGPLLSRRV
jgi:flagellar protein FlaG